MGSRQVSVCLSVSLHVCLSVCLLTFANAQEIAIKKEADEFTMHHFIATLPWCTPSVEEQLSCIGRKFSSYTVVIDVSSIQLRNFLQLTALGRGS